MEQKKYKLESLIVLSYSKDNVDSDPIIYVTEAKNCLNSQAYKGEISINLEEGTWEYLNFKKIPIGDSIRKLEGYRKNSAGIIGIYNRMNTTHLDSMAKTTQRVRLKK